METLLNNILIELYLFWQGYISPYTVFALSIFSLFIGFLLGRLYGKGST